MEKLLRRQVNNTIIVTRMLLWKIWATPNHVLQKTFHYLLVAWLCIRNNSNHVVYYVSLWQNHIPNLGRISTCVRYKPYALIYHLDIIRSQDFVKASWNIVVRMENWQDFFFVPERNVYQNPSRFQLIKILILIMI